MDLNNTIYVKIFTEKKTGEEPIAKLGFVYNRALKFTVINLFKRKVD